MAGHRRRPGIGSSLAFTLGSAVLWGLAHLRAGRRRTGVLLMVSSLTVITAAATAFLTAESFLLTLAVRPGWLQAFGAVALLLGTVTVAVVIRSYRLLRPEGLGRAGRRLSAFAVGLLCVLVMLPAMYAARLAHVSQHVMTTLFAAGPTPVPADPWQGRERLNVLLVGADAATGRYGVRTDSVTVASVDTRTGDTVLLGLPRNLGHVPMPAGPARDRFPHGFAGEPPHTPGILNEIWQYAEDHPETVPGTPDGERGPTLLKRAVGDVLGLDLPYYAMVDMRGFAKMIDAMGGVRLTVPEPIVYGRRNEGVVQPGTRVLSGEEALWYGRSRTHTSDYVRMSRQKCLLNAVAKQADPVTVIGGFEEIADAALDTVSTDIPRALLPHLVDLAEKVKGTRIRSLQFVPPVIDPVAPDYALIRRKAAAALSPAATAAPRPAPRQAPAPAPPARTPATPADPESGPGPAPEPGSTATATPSPTPTPTPQETVVLDETCP
ncbi:LCP family protein [Planomonospora sp. ID91781]|uniref:LCP family protein n=1 Tax=Planomonospora sp. ID91781 TaxID=2738135 RepID=UPI0018C40634|nr:LCP family protein [Planomonospora sp. ID91781]MBG0819829.1 LCP family protein [Planomonospora sp. ID91781]